MCSIDQTTPRSSSSLIQYLSLIIFRKREANATVCQPSGVRCFSPDPKLFLEASDYIRAPRSDLMCLFSVDLAVFSVI